MLGNRTAPPAVVLAFAAMLAQPAAASSLAEVTDKSFDADVIRASQATPVVVVFIAAWCGPCPSMMPSMEQVAEQYQGQVTFTKLDIDQSSAAPMTYGVSSLPTTVVFKGGQVVDTKLGAMSRDILDKWIAPHAR